MSEFLEQGVKFGMGGGAEKVLEDPTEGFLGFGGGGFEKLAEEMKCFAEVVLVHGILFTRPIKMFQQYSKNILRLLIFCE